MEAFFVIAVCLVLNALFACFEMAFVTVTKPQLRNMEKKGDKRAARILRLRENPERTLSVIQVGITLVGMISAAVGGAGADKLLSPYLEARFGISENWAEAIAVLSVVLPLTFLSVVLGELVPKTIALRNPLFVASIGAKWIVLADRIFSPLVNVLEQATKLILRLVPRKRPDPLTNESSGTVEIDQLSQQTQQYVLNLVRIESRKVKEAMVPWSQVIFVQESDDHDRVAATVVSSGHTRLPVLRNNKVIGILHTKEFISLLTVTTSPWQTLIRPVIELKENERMLKALRAMQDKRTHLSVILNNALEPLGIVTMEDVIEEVVGEIYDEDDDGRTRLFINRQLRKGRS